AINYLYEYLTIPATIIASRIFVEALEKLINNIHQKKCKKENDTENKKSYTNDTKEKDCSGKNVEIPTKFSDTPLKDSVLDPKNPFINTDFNRELSKKENSLTNQKITIKIRESGVLKKSLSSCERKHLSELKKIMRKGGRIGEIIKNVQKEMEEGRKEIDQILKSIGKRVEKTHTEYIYENGEEITVLTYDSPKELKEINGVSHPSKSYIQILKNYGYIIKRLQRNLSKLRHRIDFRRGTRRGIICRRDLIKVISSKGKFDRPFKIFQRKTGVKLLILIDESGSMMGDYVDAPRTSTDGCSDGYSPIFIAKRSAIILAEALKGTRVRFGVVGFSAVGKELKIVEKVYKRFDESINTESLGAIGISDFCFENRDGTSFSIAVKHHFKSMQGDVPIMIIISDGVPWHAGTSYVGKNARDRTSQSVQALKQVGIKMFALSIDLHGDQYLKNIYGRRNYVVLKQPKDITEKLVNLVSNIAASLN
ncbi:MAG: cobaltochelatase CobT-related protein, partial [Promethearchaeota archaeon]